MKLLYCPRCHDIQAFCYQDRVCLCGASSGRLLDPLKAVVRGVGVVLGINNHSFLVAVAAQPEFGRGRNFEAFVLPRECPSVINE